MKIFFIGGTGFLGYHATTELIKRGHKVTILSLPPLPAPGLFPDEVHIELRDLGGLADAEVLEMLEGQDALVFAAGADDRVTPKAPAYPFFFKHNVQAVQRVIRLARQAGLKKSVILGSYFAHFSRIWPEMNLARHHPYIRSRVEQERAAIEAGGEDMAVMILELPYIFGTMPGRVPLWKPLVQYAASGLPLLYPRGGTTCVTVQQVAQAIAGALEKGRGGACYPIGGKNLTWSVLMAKIAYFAGREKHVITLPNWILYVGTWFVKIFHRLQGRESGLDPVAFVKLQTAETYIDNAATRAELGYADMDLDAALQETVDACLNK